LRNGTLDERAADRRWAEVLGSLRTDRVEMASALTGQVRVSGADTVVTRQAFLGMLDRRDAEGYGWLDSSLLGDRAATRDGSRVVNRWEHRTPSGLSEVVAVVDYTTDIPAYEFRQDPGTPQTVPQGHEQPSDDFAVPQMPGLDRWQLDNGSAGSPW
jgi:hypothetical protein